MNQKNNALALKKICFKFNSKSKPFFDEANATFTSGAIHFIQGQNGVGKSTFFRILQGKIDRGEIASGSIELDGTTYDLSSTQSSRLQQHIKFVQQKFDLMLASNFSFEDNLRCASLPHYPNVTPLPKHAILPPFIKRFGINPKQLVQSLSGGQRQILAILMALQKPTKILLLDEPTAALDTKNSHMVMEFLKELVSSTPVTILIICHNQELVNSYAQYGYFHITVDDNLLRTITFIQKTN